MFKQNDGFAFTNLYTAVDDKNKQFRLIILLLTNLLLEQGWLKRNGDI